MNEWLAARHNTNSNRNPLALAEGLTDCCAHLGLKLVLRFESEPGCFERNYIYYKKLLSIVTRRVRRLSLNNRARGPYYGGTPLPLRRVSHGVHWNRSLQKSQRWCSYRVVTGSSESTVRRSPRKSCPAAAGHSGPGSPSWTKEVQKLPIASERRRSAGSKGHERQGGGPPSDLREPSREREALLCIFKTNTFRVGRRFHASGER